MKKRILLLSTLALIIVPNLNAQSPIDLAETTVKIGGLGEQEYYFGFAEGDQIIFNFKELKGKDLKEIEIIELPSTSKFADFKAKKIENKTLNVTSTGIYKFRFSNGALGGRICEFKIQRIPGSASTKGFNSSVYWRTLYDTTYTTVQEDYLIRKEFVPRVIVPTSEHFVNSGSNALLMGGKSRISIPVTLPPNTQEWYYEFSASRDKEEIDNIRSTFNLVGQLSNLIDPTGALNIGIELLTQPPGGDICDVYMMSFENSQLFEAKQAFSYLPVGSRENIKSGIVKVNIGNNETVYLGIKNPSSTDGIHLALEVVAIVLEEEWGVRDVQKMNVREWQEPYLKN